LPCALHDFACGASQVQKYVGEGARMVRELFQMARSKKVRTSAELSFCQEFCLIFTLHACSSPHASDVGPLQACIVFFDEVDAIGGARHDDGAGGDNEVQRTMLEIVNQLDGFDARGNVKVSEDFSAYRGR
jgi:26S proteasome regulatory subunit T1